MNPIALKTRFAAGAAEINRLHKRIHETVVSRGKSAAERAEWMEACAELHRRYDGLAFPGGYGEALLKLERGDVEVLETALTFLEVRPYFFRSGYMFTTLMRRVKRAKLSLEQRERLNAVLARRAAWRALRRR